MLDDLKYIHERDAQDALGLAQKQGDQLNQKFSTEITVNSVTNVVLAGMGGSALPGLFLQSWPGTKVPFEIVRGYDIPGYVSERTLFISSSYSGNTEETLAALEKAEAVKAQIVVVAAGGKLADIAKQKNYPLLEIPGGLQPRMSSFYFIAALLDILEKTDLLLAKTGDLNELGDWLNSEATKWQADKPIKDNLAKQIALELMGKTVIVYSGPALAAAANKWKIGLNENAKNLAWWNQYPEFNHNEFIGWSSHPVDKPFAVVELQSSLDNERIQKRFKVSQKLLSGRRPSPIVVTPKGDDLPKQMFWASILGDFVSIYLALLNGVNPTPVELVEKLKQSLDE